MLTESDLENLLRAQKQPFCDFVILGWYDGVLSAIATVRPSRVALYLEGAWADRAFPDRDSYLYRVSQINFDDVEVMINKACAPWELANSEALDRTIAQAKASELLVSLAKQNSIFKVWRPVEAAHGTP